METHMTLAQVKAVDDELNKLAYMVELRLQVRRCRENLTAYVDMSGRRIASLKTALADAEARVAEFAAAGVQS